jgi:nucleoside-diphosphate-sugar epimerase
VLVTGATGLVGSQALPALAALGFEVVGLARRPPAASPFRHVQADLFDHSGLFWTAPENLDHVAATLVLARAAEGVRFVGLGSSAEYDWTTGAHPRREDEPTAPATLYGTAKDAARRLLAAHLDARFAWARLFHIFGPGEPPARLVPAIAAALRAGAGYTVRHGLLRVDYMATADVGTALAALVASDVAGPVNIGSGEAVTLGDLARQIATLVGGSGLAVEDGAPAAMLPDLTRLREAVGVPPPPPLAERLSLFLRNN